MRPFFVSIHDATPAFVDETRFIIRDLAPLIGRRLSFGVVPNWHGEWPLASYPGYCRLLEDSSEELLLHGYFHRRADGFGPATLLAGRCDEMNGLDSAQTERTLERGQSIFADTFGYPARGFIAPGWQQGQLTLDANTSGLQHVVGFFSLSTSSGERVPLTTWTWDCSRWGWTGNLGHGIGWLMHSIDRGIPTLAIHPRDPERGYWPKILRLTQELLDSGYEPTTFAGFLERPC